MKLSAFAGLVIIFCLSVKAQTTSNEAEGVVSYITSQNIYVRYSSTAGIKAGDTLYFRSDNKLLPALVVSSLSSTSAVCILIADKQMNVNDKVIAKRNIQPKENFLPKPVVINDSIIEKDTTTISTKDTVTAKTPSRKQDIYGYARIYNYSNFTNTPAPISYVNGMAFSFNIKNIADSKFSLESNMLFRLKNDEWEETKSNVFNSLKIYNISVKYDVTKSLFLILGRKINPNISNIGALDGLQAQKSFKGLFVGLFAGARPDYEDYGFNFNLFQYGAYVGYDFRTVKRDMMNSLAYVEQMNDFNTDRRFLYFQHNSNLLKNVNVFVTAEMDLFKIVNEQKQNDFSLTNLYCAIRWRPVKKLSLTGTYDARNNVIYYETYKDYLSTMIEVQTRQGYGFQMNYNMAKYLSAGFRVGYRFQQKDPRPTKNAYLYITYSNIARSLISITVSSTILETSYLQGNVYNGRLSRPFNKGKMHVGCGYSYVDYKIVNDQSPFVQHIADINFTTQIYKKLSLALNTEANFEDKNQFYRLYVQLKQRF